MPKVEIYRALIESRACGSCEYCRLLQVATGVTFHVEHVLPRSQGGKTTLHNLALSCPGCNLAKSDRVFGADSNGELQPLFNPRGYEPWLLGWHLHFTLDTESALIMPRTAVGEATVATLQVNDPMRVFARQLQIILGLLH